jgi:hypothetical protein
MLLVLFLLSTLLVSNLSGSPLLLPGDIQEFGRIVNGRDAHPGINARKPSGASLG